MQNVLVSQQNQRFEVFHRCPGTPEQTQLLLVLEMQMAKWARAGLSRANERVDAVFETYDGGDLGWHV